MQALKTHLSEEDKKSREKLFEAIPMAKEPRSFREKLLAEGRQERWPNKRIKTGIKI